MIRAIGFRRTVALLGGLANRWPRLRRSPSSAGDLGATVEWSVPGRFGPTCLDRSTYLWFVLSLHGIESSVRIGVLPAEGGGIEGHAWVEHDGEVLNDVATIADDYFVFEDDPTTVIFR